MDPHRRRGEADGVPDRGRVTALQQVVREVHVDPVVPGMAQPQATIDVDRTGQVPELPGSEGQPLAGDRRQGIQVDRIGEPPQLGERARRQGGPDTGSPRVGIGGRRDPDQPRGAGPIADVLLVEDPFIDRPDQLVPDRPRRDPTAGLGRVEPP